MNQVDDDTHQFGIDTMEYWPTDHRFIIYEMNIKYLCMIANYGGGGSFSNADCHGSDYQQHAEKFPIRRISKTGTVKRYTIPGSARPDLGDDAAGYVRWLVAKSLWKTVTIIFSREDDQAFGTLHI